MSVSSAPRAQATFVLEDEASHFNGKNGVAEQTLACTNLPKRAFIFHHSRLEEVHARIAANPRAFNSSRRRRLVCLSSHGGTRDGQQQRAAPREELIAEFAPDAWPAYFTARASMAGAAGSSVVQAAGMTPLGSPHDDLCWLKTSFGADWGSASKVNHPWDSEVRKLLRVL